MIVDPVKNDEIRLVSWDVDGTLFSFVHLAVQLVRRVFHDVNSLGWRPTSTMLRQVLQFHRTVERQRRNPDRDVIVTELEEVKIGQTLQREAMQSALLRIPPRHSAVKLLEDFKRRGMIQVALSDFECDFKLEALGLSRFFQKAYSCQQFGFWKPSPVPLMKIQREYGVTPEQHLHIGDRRNTDGKACFDNGCRFLLI